MNHYTLAEMTPGLTEEFTVTVTPEMMDEAEQPELGDFSLVHLPARRFNLRTEELQMKIHRRQTADSREPVEAFITRLRGRGSP